MTEIDMSEYMITSRKYTNNCSYFNNIIIIMIIIIIIITLSFTYTHIHVHLI